MEQKTLTKTYQIIIQDEYNNLYHTGFYKKLEDGLEDINDFLEPYETQIDELKEYSGTFSMCFDKSIEIEEGELMIRGFIFENDNHAEQLRKEEKVLTEITDFCRECPSHEDCPEEECVLYRIEQIIENVSNRKEIN